MATPASPASPPAWSPESLLELLDRGYQKFFKTSKVEIAATAERLQSLHRFSEELKEALGYTSLYNEGLGSVSASYQYDRVAGRDLPKPSALCAPGRNSPHQFT